MASSQEKDNEDNIIYSGINQQSGNIWDFGENTGQQTKQMAYLNMMLRDNVALPAWTSVSLR